MTAISEQYVRFNRYRERVSRAETKSINEDPGGRCSFSFLFFFFLRRFNEHEFLARMNRAHGNDKKELGLTFVPSSELRAFSVFQFAWKLSRNRVRNFRRVPRLSKETTGTFPGGFRNCV